MRAKPDVWRGTIATAHQARAATLEMSARLRMASWTSTAIEAHRLFEIADCVRRIRAWRTVHTPADPNTWT